jgi:hypothetical protein
MLELDQREIADIAVIADIGLFDYREHRGTQSSAQQRVAPNIYVFVRVLSGEGFSDDGDVGDDGRWRRTPRLCIFPLTLRPTYLNILGVRRFHH